MKKIIILSILLLSMSAMAKTNPTDYVVMVHVTESSMVFHNGYYQHLGAIIDGRKYELETQYYTRGILAPGDYKAKLADTGGKSQYDSWQVYELLLPDNKTRRFVVMEVKQ